MALPLPNTDRITANSHRKTSNRVMEAQFGEGFKQIAPDGLNSDIDTWVIEYAPVEGTVLTELEAFFTAVGVSNWFTWTPLGEVTSKKWRINKDSLIKSMITTSKFKYKFSMTQQFDLG